MARHALFVGAALAAMALPIGIGDHNGWITDKSAFASHDESNDSGPGHGGQGNGGGGNSGGAGTPGGGGGSGSSGGGSSGGGSGGGNSGSAGDAGGGQDSSDNAERDQDEAATESFVEDQPENQPGADVSDIADARAPGGDGLGVPNVAAVIGAAGTTTVTAAEELALISAGWQ